MNLKSIELTTPIGSMIAVASDEHLYLLEFIDSRGLKGELKRLTLRTQGVISPGSAAPLDSIANELDLYFKNEIKIFKTPVCFLGSPFQTQVWQELIKIPHGQTRSYLELAKIIQRPTASRAVARANSTNQLAIIVPCHRVIQSNGELGGYAGGVKRKAWLLAHEN